MSFENRDVVLDADVDMAEPSGSAGDEGGWEDVEGFNVLPPGKEGLFMSNAGSGEDVFHEIIDKVAPKKYVAIIPSPSLHSANFLFPGNKATTVHVGIVRRYAPMPGASK